MYRGERIPSIPAEKLSEEEDAYSSAYYTLYTGLKGLECVKEGINYYRKS